MPSTKELFRFFSWFFTYLDAVMMMKLACDEFFGVVVNVGWEQFAQDFSAHDIGEYSQVKGETWRYVDTSKPTLAAFKNIIRTNVGDIEVGESVSLEFGVSHSSLCASTESFTTSINDLNCRDIKQKRKGVVMKFRRENRLQIKWCFLSYKKRKRLPLEAFDVETMITNTSR